MIKKKWGSLFPYRFSMGCSVPMLQIWLAYSHHAMFDIPSIFTSAGGFGMSQACPEGKKKLESPSGWWFFATPLKNDGLRQLG